MNLISGGTSLDSSDKLLCEDCEELMIPRSSQSYMAALTRHRTMATLGQFGLLVCFLNGLLAAGGLG